MRMSDGFSSGVSSLGAAASLGTAAAMAATSTAPAPPPAAPLPSTAASADIPQIPMMDASFGDGGRAAQAAQARLIESVKFELEVRASLADKQLHAVREEMSANTSATEKKWVDIARQVETSVEARLEAESKLRGLTEEKIERLRDAAASAHQETVRMVGDMQQTAIDHSQVLQRLDADLSAFRKSSEVRMAEVRDVGIELS